MVDRMKTMPKAEVEKVLHRVGIPATRVAEVLAELDDPIDFVRDRALLDRIGLNRDNLTDMMGGSP